MGDQPNTVLGIPQQHHGEQRQDRLRRGHLGQRGRGDRGDAEGERHHRIHHQQHLFQSDPDACGICKAWLPDGGADGGKSELHGLPDLGAGGHPGDPDGGGRSVRRGPEAQAKIHPQGSAGQRRSFMAGMKWYKVWLVVPGTDGDAENGPCEPEWWNDMEQAPDEETAVRQANEKARRQWEEPNQYEPGVEAPSDREMGHTR